VGDLRGYDPTLNVSNLSNIQKELRPNKTVKGGNSVFSNKLTIMKSNIKAPDSVPESSKHSQITKLNAHQITRYTQNTKKTSFTEKEKERM
jgi:hypothetical protein